MNDNLAIGRGSSPSLALSSSLIALIGSLFASWILYSEFAFRGRRNADTVGLTLFVVGVPLMFLQMLTSAVTIKLAFGDFHEPLGRRKSAIVLLPQTLALVLPFLVVLVFGHAV